MEIDIHNLQLNGPIEATGAPGLDLLTAPQMAICSVIHAVQTYKRQCNVYPHAALQKEVYSILCQLALSDLRQLCKIGTLTYSQNVNGEIVFTINTSIARK